MAQVTSNIYPSHRETFFPSSPKEQEYKPIVGVWEKACEDRISHDDPKKLTAMEEDEPVALSPIAHSSDSDSEGSELPVTVEFCVEDEPSFTFKGTHLLSKMGNQISDLTPFFFIRMVYPKEGPNYFEKFSEYAKCSHIEQVPVDLVKRALETKSITIPVNNHTVEIELSYDEGLTRDQIRDKIQETEANQDLLPREIAPDNIESFEKNSILIV